MTSGLLLLQVAVIVGFSRAVAWVFRRFGQPQVVGEMAAGIALGPSLFGLLAPLAYRSLFPPASLGPLNVLSQWGLVIFVFLVGVRVDVAELRHRSGVAITISSLSVILPLLMGIGLAQYLYPRYGGGDSTAFAIFIGTAMSVTALPVLARILTERNLLNTGLGAVAMACAAVDDVTAWVLLSIIVAMTKHRQNVYPFWLILYVVLYLIVMFGIGRLLDAWSKYIERKIPHEVTLILVLVALTSGAVAEWIGVHAVVGAFVAGLMTPRRFRQPLIDKLEEFTLVLLVPIFFVITGMRTDLAFRPGSGAYFDMTLILLVAVTSKWGGTMIGACANGMGWREANHLGLMLNTRGLVELIVLNTGLDSGIISHELFSMIVFVAFVTTFMATPLMDWFGVRGLKAITAEAGN